MGEMLNVIKIFSLPFVLLDDIIDSNMHFDSTIFVKCYAIWPYASRGHSIADNFRHANFQAIFSYLYLICVYFQVSIIEHLNAFGCRTSFSSIQLQHRAS